MDSIKISLDSLNTLLHYKKELEKINTTISYCDHIKYIILIVLVSGIIGGITNFFFSNSEKTFRYTNSELQNNGKLKWYEFLKAIFTGWSAALVVPVLLQAISSNLLTTSRIEPTQYLIITGFCILGAVYADRFLQSVYDRIIKLEAKTTEADKKVDEVKDIVNEIETKNEESENDINSDNITSKIDSYKINDNFGVDEIIKVIDSIKKSKYIYRTFSGIAKELSFTNEKVIEILDFLETIKIVESRLNKSKNKVWKLV